MQEKKSTILVVDDEQDLVDILAFNLKTAGYLVETACSAEEALTKDLSKVDLILLDVMMSPMSGFEMAALLKRDPSTDGIPIIFLTAKDREEDTVAGLRIGADDYVSKPFSIQELILRIKAVLRRSSGAPSKGAGIDYEALHLDLTGKSLTIDGHTVPLTRTEFDLLSVLLRNPGRVFSRNELIGRVWPDGVIITDRSVDVNITRLRKKLGRYAGKIVTRSGFGYCFSV